MRGLRLRIGLRDQRAGFAQAEAQLAKESLALTRLQIDTKLLHQIAGKGLAIPNPTPCHSGGAGTLAQRSLDSGQLCWTQAGRPPRAVCVGQSSQARRFKAVHPILHRAWRIAQHTSSLTTTDAMGDQQHAMQPVVVARFARTTSALASP